MKKLSKTVVFLLCSLLFLSCDKDKRQVKQLSGTWTFSHVEIDGVDVTDKWVGNRLTLSDASNIMELGTDSFLFTGTWACGYYDDQPWFNLDYSGINLFPSGDTSIIIRQRFMLGCFIVESNKEHYVLEGTVSKRVSFPLSSNPPYDTLSTINLVICN